MITWSPTMSRRLFAVCLQHHQTTWQRASPASDGHIGAIITHAPEQATFSAYIDLRLRTLPIDWCTLNEKIFAIFFEKNFAARIIDSLHRW